MTATHGLEGVIAPALTPFDADGNPCANRLVAHCQWLMDTGCTGLAPFGTTSEAASLGLDERLKLLDALIEAGLPAEKLMPGTGLTSIPDTVKLTAAAASHKVGGVLLLPPFYFKGVSDDGIYGHVAEVIEQVGSSDLRVYLYHIPPVAQVGYSLDVIARLRAAYPETVIGLKDSSGDWSNTEAVINNNPGFDVFPGSEIFLLKGLRAGGVGCITASANVNAAAIRKVFDNWQTPEADALQAAIETTRKAIQAHPMIPALKAIKAAMLDDPAWARPRPPLDALPEAAASALISELDGTPGFEFARQSAA